jgi:hypothetical protein
LACAVAAAASTKAAAMTARVCLFQVDLIGPLLVR